MLSAINQVHEKHRKVPIDGQNLLNCNWVSLADDDVSTVAFAVHSQLSTLPHPFACRDHHFSTSTVESIGCLITRTTNLFLFTTD